MTFNKVLSKYWSAVSDEGIEQMAQRFDQSVQVMADDVRNLMTNVEEIARDDIVERGGSYRDFERRLDFEYRLVNLQYLTGLAISLDQLHDDLEGKVNPQFLNLMLVRCFQDWCDALKTTKMYESTKGVLDILDGIAMGMNSEISMQAIFKQDVNDSDADDFADEDLGDDEDELFDDEDELVDDEEYMADEFRDVDWRDIS